MIRQFDFGFTCIQAEPLTIGGYRVIAVRGSVERSVFSSKNEAGRLEEVMRRAVLRLNKKNLKLVNLP